MRQPLVRCVEFVESVTDWMEGALTDDERVALEEHLTICPHCTDYVAQLRLSSAVLRAAEGAKREAPPPEARETLLAEFRRHQG